MRVLVIGNNSFVRYFASQANDGLDMAELSDTAGLPAALDIAKYELVLVDGQELNAGDTCEFIKSMCRVPVALLVNERTAKWNRFEGMGVDGFIPETARGAELKARLNAILRRFNYATARPGH